ncbi:hypothetical protein QTP88_017166 [Uroleucon formosanum]
MNEFSTSIQGKQKTIFDANDKIFALKKKITFYIESVDNKDLTCFSLTSNFLQENELKINESFLEIIKEHLNNLLQNLNSYFPKDVQESIRKNYEWILNPFSVTSKPAALNAAEYEVLIDMVSDSYYQTSFKSKPISEFWAQLGKDHSILSSKAKLLLLPFGTTYLCETAFSRYTATKTKYRSRLDAEDDMRLQLTSVIPDIDKLSVSAHEKIHDVVNMLDSNDALSIKISKKNLVKERIQNNLVYITSNFKILSESILKLQTKNMPVAESLSIVDNAQTQYLNPFKVLSKNIGLKTLKQISSILSGSTQPWMVFPKI